MNYYPRYPGDYLRDTAHLSLVEHGVYTILLDHYYSREQPLPADIEQLIRIARATVEYEQAAVRSVAEEFFPIDSRDGLRHNRRADEELQKWHDFQTEQSRKGKLGGRPPKAEQKPEESRGISRDKAGVKPEESPGKAEAKAGEKPEGKPGESPPTPTPDPDPTPESGVLFEDSRPQERPQRPKLTHDAVIQAYHDLLPDLPRVKAWSPKRKQSLDARIRERCAAGKPADAIEYWRQLFSQVAESDFLCGRGKTEFRADLEWLLRPENFLKVIEGRYANRRPGNGGHRAGAR